MGYETKFSIKNHAEEFRFPNNWNSSILFDMCYLSRIDCFMLCLTVYGSICYEGLRWFVDDLIE